MNAIKRINFFEDLGDKKATISYFLQEGLGTCNASCKGCYAGAGEISSNLTKGIVRPEEAEKDIGELIKEYRVFLRGTEILLNPGYIPLLKLAKNKVILTNGIVLGKFPERLDILAANDVSNIIVTLPFKNTPASARNLADLLRHKNTILKGIKLIKQHEYGFVLQLSALITADCLKEQQSLEKICNEALDIGADVIRFIPYVAISGDSSIDNYALSKEERIKLVEQCTRLKQEYDKKSLVIHTPGVLGLFPLRAEYKKILEPNLSLQEEKLVCPAGIKYFVISSIKKKDEDGRIYRQITPCHFMMNVEIGEYYGGSNLKINNLLLNQLTLERSDCIAQNYWYGLNVK